MNAAARHVCAAFVAAAAVHAAAHGGAQPAPDLNDRFSCRDGWAGADGIYAVALSPARTLWLFSDTWTGEVRDGRRLRPRMVNNSVGVTEGGGHARFTVATNRNGEAQSIFLPPDGRGWYWPWAAVRDDRRLFLFAARVEKKGGDGAFGFAHIGTALGIVDAFDGAPAAWRVRWRNVPETWAPSVFWGSSALVYEGAVYLYGYTENRRTGLDFRRHMLLARAPPARLDDFDAWRFYSPKGWLRTPAGAAALCPDVAAEYSVTFLPSLNRFLLVTHDAFLSPTIVARTAPAPWGPWSEKKAVYTCPEADPRRGVFCYAAKLQPALSDSAALVISYAANANDAETVFGDASLYMPRFIRVPIGDFVGLQP